MLCGLTHLVLVVADLERAARVYRDAFGFRPIEHGGTHLDLDASPLVLRLELAGEAIAPARLRIQTLAIEEMVRRLEAAGAHHLSGPASDFARNQRSAELIDPDGHRLELWRRLREDELPAPPPLPISRPWAPAAEALARSLLADVPEPLRDLARRGTVAEAEYLCPDDEDVSAELYVRAFIRATPRLVRAELREPLRARGYDPASYEADFTC